MKRIALLILIAALLVLLPAPAEAGSTLPVPDRPIAIYPVQPWNPWVFRPYPIYPLPLFPF